MEEDPKAKKKLDGVDRGIGACLEGEGKTTGGRSRMGGGGKKRREEREKIGEEKVLTLVLCLTGEIGD